MNWSQSINSLKYQTISILFKISFLPHRKHSIVNINQLMWFREVTDVYLEIHKQDVQ